MTGLHGVSLKPFSEVNYALKKRERIIDNLVIVHSLRNILRSQGLECQEYAGGLYKELTNS